MEVLKVNLDNTEIPNPNPPHSVEDPLDGSPQAQTEASNLTPPSFVTKDVRQEKYDDAESTAEQGTVDVPMIYDQSSCLQRIANAMRTTYRRTGDMDDIHQAIADILDKLVAIPMDSPDRGPSLSNLANHLHVHYIRTGDMDHLTQAIRFDQDAVEATPQEDPCHAAYLGNMANRLCVRYDKTGEIQDIDQAVACAQSILATAPLDSPNRGCILNNLAGYCHTKYDQTGHLGDLTQAIHYDREALVKTPLDHFHRSAHLDNMADRLSIRYNRTGDKGDIEQAIMYAQELVGQTPKTHASRPSWLVALARYLVARYDQCRGISDLQKAIEYDEEALGAMLQDDPDRLMLLNDLGEHLSRRHNQTGEMWDLQRAIRYAEKVLAETPDDSHLRGCRLSHLSLHLSSRYDQTGETGDLEQALSYARAASTAAGSPPVCRAGHLANLSVCLSTKYRQSGALGDLHQAIMYAEDSLAATPQGHNRQASHLAGLASCLTTMYHRTRVVDYLQKSIEYYEEALKTAPPTGPVYEICLDRLASGFVERFTLGGIKDSFVQGENFAQKVLATLSLTGRNRAGALDRLSTIWTAKYKHSGELGDLEQSIQYAEEALVEAGRNHPYLSHLTRLLAINMFRRFKRNGSAKDLSDCIMYSKRCWDSHHSSPSSRISVAIWLFRILHYSCEAKESESRSLLQRVLHDSIPELNSLLEEAVMLLPKLSPRSMERHDQQHALSKIPGLAANAASCALAAGKTACHALQLLELGRGVIMGFAIDCRGDLRDLRETDPELHDRFNDLRSKIDSEFPEISHSLTDIPPRATQYDGWPEACNYHRTHDLTQDRTWARERQEKATVEIEEVIAEIRRLPGHERFRLPPSEQELMSMADQGPIVVFISTTIGSDAIIVTSSTIDSIPLPKLHYHEISSWLQGMNKLAKGGLRKAAAGNQKMREILFWLWDVAVRPVLEQLQLTAQDTDLPHIWWIGVGALSMAPFHAAGDYSDPEKNTMSYAISSYTPTIKALMYARARDSTMSDGHKSDNTNTGARLLLVTMPTTPGSRSLPSVGKEVAEISRITNGVVLTEHLHQPCAKAILDQLQGGSCHAIHFACHGVSIEADPSSSHLILLKDNEADKLTVQDISRQNTNTAQIAYLSACSTADNPSYHLADEIIHIASGFQLAGFNHVLAAMWPTQSKVCTEISTSFYRSLFDGNGGGHRKTRIAFHRAVKDAQREYWDFPVKWAQFIHLGA